VIRFNFVNCEGGGQRRKRTMRWNKGLFSNTERMKMYIIQIEGEYTRERCKKEGEAGR
jgi:hypothetical protein